MFMASGASNSFIHCLFMFIAVTGAFCSCGEGDVSSAPCPYLTLACLHFTPAIDTVDVLPGGDSATL